MTDAIERGRAEQFVRKRLTPFAKIQVARDYVELDCQVYVGFPFEIYSGVGFSLRRSSN